MGLQELALQLQRLDLALGLQVDPGGVGQHRAAGGFHAVGALLVLVQRQADQQGDHEDQAQAGEQDDLALDIEVGSGHGNSCGGNGNGAAPCSDRPVKDMRCGFPVRT
ncbi:hypothetical protein D9M73_163970 [compost metagenome]